MGEYCPRSLAIMPGKIDRSVYSYSSSSQLLPFHTTSTSKGFMHRIWKSSPLHICKIYTTVTNARAKKDIVYKVKMLNENTERKCKMHGHFDSKTSSSKNNKRTQDKRQSLTLQQSVWKCFFSLLFWSDGKNR